MATNSLSETKTLHRLADFFGLKSGASRSQVPADRAAMDTDKLDDSDPKPAAPTMPQTPATGF